MSKLWIIKRGDAAYYMQGGEIVEGVVTLIDGCMVTVRFDTYARRMNGSEVCTTVGMAIEREIREVQYRIKVAVGELNELKTTHDKLLARLKKESEEIRL